MMAIAVLFAACGAARSAQTGGPRYGLHLHRDGSSLPMSAARGIAKVVVLVHGLDEPGTIWRALIPELEAEGFTVCEFTYPNDQRIRLSSIHLAAELEAARQSGLQRIDLVAHSMGGLVCRELLTSPGIEQASLPRVDRLIMVGTPNHGSDLVRFRVLAEARDQVIRLYNGERLWMSAFADGGGEAAEDLVPGSAFLTELNARQLPITVAVSIIAGDASPVRAQTASDLIAWLRSHGYGSDDDLINWSRGLAALANGSGDGAVSVASSRLVGVDDHLVLHADHLSLLERAGPNEPAAIEPIRQRLREQKR